MESQLNDEKIISIQLQQNLSKANEELQWLRKEKEMNERSCFEAFKKVEEFRVLRNKSQERVDALEKEITRLTSAMVDIDLAKHEMSEQGKEKEQNLQSFEDMVAK